jgi:alcohol dehydrogenase (cytochrome c)
VTSSIVALDPSTGEIKQRKNMPYGNSAGALATAGGLIFTALLDGTIMALDDQTLEELWSINVGTGVNAAPIAYEVDGKQYIAIATGLTRNQVGRLANSPETRGLAKHATMLFVFGL